MCEGYNRLNKEYNRWYEKIICEVQNWKFCLGNEEKSLSPQNIPFGILIILKLVIFLEKKDSEKSFPFPLTT